MAATESPTTNAARVVAFTLLKDRRAWGRTELEVELSAFEPLAVNEAIDQLAQHEVVHLDGEQVRPSLGARWLSELGLLRPAYSRAPDVPGWLR